MDVGLGADLLGDVEGALKGFVQQSTGVVVLEREVVGFLELAEDFRFTEDHGFEAGGDSEQVLDALGFSQLVDFVRDGIAVVVNLHEELVEFLESLTWFEAGSHVQFDPVARGENHDFVNKAGLA